MPWLPRLAPVQNRKSRKSLLLPRSGAGRRAGLPGLIPVKADHDDEITDEELRRIKDAVRLDVEEEELETIDGPGW